MALDQSIANMYGLTVQNSTGGYYGTNVFKTKNHGYYCETAILLGLQTQLLAIH